MKHVFKKLLCTVLLLLTLTACTPVKEENSVAENSTLSKTQHSVVEYSDPYAARQTERVRFRVNDSMPSYEAVVVLTEDGVVELLAFCGVETGEVLQTVEVEDEFCQNKQPYALDVTFDGNVDILIPYAETSRATYFHAYIWDAEGETFVHAPTFSQLPNFVLDSVNKQILGYSSGDMLVNYAVGVYDKDIKNFAVTNELYYEYLINEENGDTVHFVEYAYKNGEEQLVAEYTMQGDGDYYEVDETDERMQPYLAEGSFWELYSDKWRQFALKAKMKT